MIDLIFGALAILSLIGLLAAVVIRERRLNRCWRDTIEQIHARGERMDAQWP